MNFFDAHLDLAYLAVSGRDMLAPLSGLTEASAGPHAPASVTLPSLCEGGVRLALGTIFTEPVAQPKSGGALGPEQYVAGDVARAHAVGRAQMEVYLTWRDGGRVALDLRRLLRLDAGVGSVRGGMGVAETKPLSIEAVLTGAGEHAPLHLGILVENADPIRSPEELPWWKERGVVAVGLAWARASRYAAGNATPCAEDRGITGAGLALVDAMDDLGLVHDVSHLSDRALEDLLTRTSRPVMASHSNCRAIIGDETNQRHLRDEAIIEVARRGGVIGLNLCRNFIPPAPYTRTDPRPTIDQALAHIERICELTGSRAHVGLGSDMDGGFSALDLPARIDKPADLVRLTEALARRGWSDDEIAGFGHGNWVRFFGGQ